jgi:hypothetical protein
VTNETYVTVYMNNDGRVSNRPFKGAFEETAEVCGEQYRRAAKRSGGRDTITDPTFWGVMNTNTNRIQRVVESRAEARRIRKPNEKVVAGWV